MSKIFAIVVGALVLTASIFSSSHGSDKTSALDIAVAPCSISDEDTISILSLPWGPRKSTKTPCFRYIGKGLTIAANFFLGPNGEFRYLDIFTKNADTSHFVVFVVGGPRSAILPDRAVNLDNQIYVALARSVENSHVLVPEYLGTALRSQYPDTDLDDAAVEISAMVREIRKKYPRAEIDLVAHSAGSLVALRVLASMPISTTLIAPPMVSLKELYTHPEKTDLPLDVANRQVRFYQGKNSEFDSKSIVTSQIEQVRAFSGKWFDQDVGEFFKNLSEPRLRCVSVVVGDRDRRIDIDKLPEIRRRFPNLRVHMIPGLAHSPTSKDEADSAVTSIGKDNPACR